MNNQNVKVSVIIPIYNVEKYIRKCVESALAQSYKNLEIILVDDESPDNSGAIADEFALKDSRVKVVHKKNGGVSSARNAGIEASTGEYICFIDGDDYVATDYVEHMLSIALEYDSDYVIAPQVMGTFNDKQSNDLYVREVSTEEALEMLLCYRIRVGCYSKLFRRAFLGDDLRFSEKLVMGEGFTFNSIAIQKAKRIVLTGKKIYFYRRDNITSATSKFHKERFENGLFAIEYIKENIVDKTPRVMRAWEYANWRTHSDVYDAIVLANAEDECGEMYEKCRSVVKNEGKVAFAVPIKLQDKIRAAVMMVSPRAIPFAMRIRKRAYHIGGGGT